MASVWLFGANYWQGNPKALFLYVNKYHPEIEPWWIADSQSQADTVRVLGFRSTSIDSEQAERLFSRASVYVVENFRETLPKALNPTAVILNLWHGVGLKHIEYGVDRTSSVVGSIVRKWVRNFEKYRNNLLFLATSAAMERHFIKDAKLQSHQIVRGAYLRNLVGQDPALSTYDADAVDGRSFDDFSRVVLYAPTYRDYDVKGAFSHLFPDMALLSEVLAQNNTLLIFKLHHFMLNDAGFVDIKNAYSEHPNILFWDNALDVYEIFPKIDVAIIDYSSIFYDLLEAGVRQFIRYIPDYEDYVAHRALTEDYMEHTDGVVAADFSALLNALVSPVPPSERLEHLRSHFFGYSSGNLNVEAEKIIDIAKNFIPVDKKWPNLYSYDIFDTLIRRKTVVPKSIFFAVADEMRKSGIDFPDHLVRNYPLIRVEAEADLRHVYNRTLFERKADTKEITFAAIFERIQNVYDLSPRQIDFLVSTEIALEVESVEPIDVNVSELIGHLQEGSDVILISDMYLPKDVIKKMLAVANPVLADLPIYLSSDIGHRKVDGELFKHIFFDLNYEYREWIHIGDNKKSDGVVPAKLGISTRLYEGDAFQAFEAHMADTLRSFDGFKITANMLRRRLSLNVGGQTRSQLAYFSYAYIGSYFVPYVNWVLNNAISRGYKTLYFITRDGYYLKKIADAIIGERRHAIKTKLIYGSRKAWRVPSFINEVDEEAFADFGLFAGINSFEGLVEASQLREETLLEIVPRLKSFRKLRNFDAAANAVIRRMLQQSPAYRQELLKVAAAKRPIVRKYLQQEIDFNESFAFVEFWGRGYTQDALTRLIADAAGRGVDNPFYYVRNFSATSGHSIRHRFTVLPANFNFLEPIFATTPFASISDYSEIEGHVSPVVKPTWNDYEDSISEGLTEFARDYARISPANEVDFDRQVADTAYRYHLAHPEDPYISNVYGGFSYAEAAYGQAREYAPPFDAELVLRTPIAELAALTGSMRISLSRSSDQARKAFEIRKEIEGVVEKPVPKAKRLFAPVNLKHYIVPATFPSQVVLRSPLTVHSHESLSNSSKTREIAKHTLLEVVGCVWTESGVPVLKTDNGFIAALKKNLILPRMNLDQYLVQGVKKVQLKSPQKVYSSVDWAAANVVGKLDAGEIIDIIDIHWTDGGTPRLRAEKFFLTANKKFVSLVTS